MANQVEESFGIIPLEFLNGDWQIFLIQHRHGKHWGFPKGHANKDEIGREAAIRELLEETALSVEKLLIQEPLKERYQCKKLGEVIDKTVFYYPAIVKGIAVLQTDEIMMGQWFSFKEAKEQLTFKESRETLQRVIDLLEQQDLP